MPIRVNNGHVIRFGARNTLEKLVPRNGRDNKSEFKKKKRGSVEIERNLTESRYCTVVSSRAERPRSDGNTLKRSAGEFPLWRIIDISSKASLTATRTATVKRLSTTLLVS